MHIDKFVTIITFTLFAYGCHSQLKPHFLKDYNALWVDSVFNTMTLDQKVGQLLMPRGNYSGKPHDLEKLRSWVEDYKIGGIVFFASHPTLQARVTNELQAISSIPLLIGQDFEWGLGMRLDSADRFPYGVSLGAIDGQEYLLEAMGAEVGRQCRRMGVHVNYAPVVDINNNPNNPVINFRSYGSDKHNVAQKGKAYMMGLQSQNILCTAKHFPGHGDTDADSHYDLPVINHDKKRLDEVELYPFKTLINSGVSGIMTAHLNIPALEPQKGLASTFSSQIVFNLLRRELNFEGLIFTDAMEMEGAVKNFPKGESMVRALLAGNDILETFMDVPTAVNAIKKAVLEGRISMEALNFKVKKILKAKSWVGLDNYKPIQLINLGKELKTIEADVINRKLTEASVTCLKNDFNHLPIKNLSQKIAVLTLDAERPENLVSMVRNYTAVDVFHINPKTAQNEIPKILDSLKTYDLVLASIHWPKPRASSNYGITKENTDVIKYLTLQNNVIISLLGNPYALYKLPELQRSKSLIVAYQCDSYTENIVPQILFGAIPVKGRFPIDINEEFKSGMGVYWEELGRLAYGVPEQEGIDRKTLLTGLDSIINEGLHNKAYPGAVLEVARNGRVILQKAYGFHTYDQQIIDSIVGDASIKYPIIDDAMDNSLNVSALFSLEIHKKIPGKVYTHNIYDLASLTKVLGSTLVGLKWIDEGKIQLNSQLSDFIPTWQGTNKENITFLDALTHRSGLKAWIPFWKNAIDTAATLNKAILSHPLLKDELIYTVIKPIFFKRLFGVKPKKEVNLEQTLADKPELWEKILTPETKVWKKHTFNVQKSNIYSIPIAENLWMHKNYIDSLYHQIASSPMSPYGNYVYSDLHYYLYPQLSEKIEGKPFDKHLLSIYNTIGANSLTFNPYISIDIKNIVPTEYDSLFRGQLLHGYVHDEGASMLGGISGHAGLFGNANDVTKIMQMYLQKGIYGGERYISESLIEKATQYQFSSEKNRRGLGFDKKDFNSKINNAPSLSSESSYGHSGFTGTYTWVDPSHNLVYVFLSNRVFPSRENRIMIQSEIRQKIGDHIISSINKQ